MNLTPERLLCRACYAKFQQNAAHLPLQERENRIRDSVDKEKVKAHYDDALLSALMKLDHRVGSLISLHCLYDSTVVLSLISRRCLLKSGFAK